MTIPCSVTPIKKSQRISGPNSMTSRGHRYVSPKPTPSAARSKPGPRTCNEAGGSGSFLIGIGSSRPACHSLSSCACSVASPGVPPLDVSTTTSFQPRPISARRDSDRLPKSPPQLSRQRCQPNKQGYPRPSNGAHEALRKRRRRITFRRRSSSPPLLCLSLYRQVIPAYTGRVICVKRNSPSHRNTQQTSHALQPPTPEPERATSKPS